MNGRINLKHRIQQLKHHKNFGDVEIFCSGNKKYVCNSTLLRIFSNFFAEILNDTDARTIALPTVSPEVFENFLEVIYDGEVQRNLSQSKIDELKIFEIAQEAVEIGTFIDLFYFVHSLISKNRPKQVRRF